MTFETRLSPAAAADPELSELLDDLTSDVEDLAYSACTAMEGLFQQLIQLDQMIDESVDETETSDEQQTLQDVRERLEDAWQSIGDARDLCNHLQSY